MSKMGISTVASYRGAQVFEGQSGCRLSSSTSTSPGPIGWAVWDSTLLAEEVAARHRIAYPPNGIPPTHRSLVVGGEYQWRREGEPHLFNRKPFSDCSTRPEKRMDIFREYSRSVDDQSKQLMTLRALRICDASARVDFHRRS